MSLQIKLFLQVLAAAGIGAGCVVFGLSLNNEFDPVTAIASGVVALIAALASGFFIAGHTKAVNSLIDTVSEIGQGDLRARARLRSVKHLRELAAGFDGVLEGYVKRVAQSQRERDALNESIVELVNAVVCLSDKDLTVALPVADDATSAVSKSINAFTHETGSVLREVSMISELVAQASTHVKNNSDKVIELANDERNVVGEVLQQITQSSSAMNEIANEAKSASTMAENVMRSTSQALGTVVKTTEGIDEIRVTISETEKRIKRLGERSQEITGIVNLINSIAERTHVLALNASMHAASAGEAGRGFAVVADEVQRLAENARQATTEISTLVNNIRVETADTVNIMNKVIGQVAEGTSMANQSGENMEQTQRSMSELVAVVQKITAYALDIAKRGESLLTNAEKIRTTTRNTDEQLAQQANRTESITQYSSRLVQAIGVFKLPEAGVEPPRLRTVAASQKTA